MWNRLLSSPYAHFVAAMTLTACFVLALLTGYSGKSSIAKFDALAESAHSDAAPGPHWSGSNSGAQLPEERIFDYSFVFPERPDRQDTP